MSLPTLLRRLAVAIPCWLIATVAQAQIDPETGMGCVNGYWIGPGENLNRSIFTEDLKRSAPAGPNDAPAIGISRVSGPMTLGFEAREGVRYRLESSEDLRNWEAIREVRDAQGPIEIQADESPNIPR